MRRVFLRAAIGGAVAGIMVGLAVGCGTTTTTVVVHPSPARSSDHGNTETASPNGCGYERWPVKTGTDAQAGQVSTTAVMPQTVAGMDQIAAPSGQLPQDSRVGPVELTVYKISATLVSYKMEADSDYHLVLTDAQGNTMIAEIPDPSCVGAGSPFLDAITAARKAFDARFPQVGGYMQQAGVPVTVTGVGFFDTIHGQTGVAPNGIEIHPVLSLTFGG